MAAVPVVILSSSVPSNDCTSCAVAAEVAEVVAEAADAAVAAELAAATALVVAAVTGEVAATCGLGSVPENSRAWPAEKAAVTDS
jgi:hypothetical protein